MSVSRIETILHHNVDVICIVEFLIVRIIFLSLVVVVVTLAARSTILGAIGALVFEVESVIVLIVIVMSIQHENFLRFLILSDVGENEVYDDDAHQDEQGAADGDTDNPLFGKTTYILITRRRRSHGVVGGINSRRGGGHRARRS